jgi:transposase
VNWLGLPGFDAEIPQHIIGETGRLEEVLIEVRPIATTYPVCCLAQKLVKNGTKAVRYRDRRRDPAPTWLIVKRQRMKCYSCGKTLYQEVPHVDDDHYITARLKGDINLAAAKRAFRDVVAIHGVEESLVRRVFRRYALDRLKDYRFDAPRVLGIDENHLFGGARGVVLDIESGQLLDMYEGCNGTFVREGVMRRMDNRENVEVWCQDMAYTYKGVARDLFPKAQIVIDKFHVLKRAGDIWTQIRRRETPHLPAEMRKAMPGIIRMFDKHWEGLSERSQDRVALILEANPRMKAAYTIKESFFYFYDKATRQDAEAAYKDWVALVRSHDVMKEWRPLMKMVATQREHIFNYFDHRYTSAKVERMNRSIVDMNRAANGLDFWTLRAKAILRYGRVVDPEEYTFYCLDGPPAEPEPWPAAIISTPFAG